MQGTSCVLICIQLGTTCTHSCFIMQNTCNKDLFSNVARGTHPATHILQNIAKYINHVVLKVIFVISSRHDDVRLESCEKESNVV